MCQDREAWRLFSNRSMSRLASQVRLTDMRYSTLKFYTEEGMISFEQAEHNLTRRYRREESLERIYYIKSLREQGKQFLK